MERRLLVVFLAMAIALPQSGFAAANQTPADANCKTLLENYTDSILQQQRDALGLKYFEALLKKFAGYVRKYEEYNAAQIHYTNVDGLNYLKLLLADLNPGEGMALMKVFNVSPDRATEELIDLINRKSVVSSNFILNEDIVQFDSANRVKGAMVGAVAGELLFESPLIGAAVGYGVSKEQKRVVGHSKVAVTSLAYPNKVLSQDNVLRTFVSDKLEVAKNIEVSAENVAVAIDAHPADPTEQLQAIKELYANINPNSRDQFLTGVLIAKQVNLAQAIAARFSGVSAEEVQRSIDGNPDAILQKLGDAVRSGASVISEIDPVYGPEFINNRVMQFTKAAKARIVRQQQMAEANARAARTLKAGLVAITIAASAIGGYFYWENYNQKQIERGTREFLYLYNSDRTSASDIEKFNKEWAGTVGSYDKLKARRDNWKRNWTGHIL